ncbi:MAG: SUMF1/EgtB/PvdO family nonheme iron enzyme [Deltaproteobacteria bacterium]|nr:SUMF1/EgtB/PvdO family nonheme iron enzyme [Deltaproteobacteria bacterium]
MRASILLGLSFLAGCVVKEHCFEDDDCPPGQDCDLVLGVCVTSEPECVVASDCGEVGFACEDGVCVPDCEPQGTVICASDQVEVCGAFCMDTWEASRPDATDTHPGTDGSMATSRPDVIPWFSADAIEGMNQTIARAACEAAGRRLCTTAEWKLACTGLDGLVYPYGDAYDPVLCNGIDTYCTCDGQDPYPHCYHDCGASFHVMPTQSFPECETAWGAWDVSGNVWEVVATDDGLDHYRGGAYNCVDSERNTRCDYDATWNPSAKGFRCCSDGEIR